MLKVASDTPKYRKKLYISGVGCTNAFDWTKNKENMNLLGTILFVWSFSIHIGNAINFLLENTLLFCLSVVLSIMSMVGAVYCAKGFDNQLKGLTKK